MAEAIHVVCPSCDAVNRLPHARLAEGPSCGRCRAPLFGGHPVALDEARFRTHVTRSDLPLVVDFWAAWCGPCRAMAPAFERAAMELEPEVRLAKVDTEQAPALSGQLAIRSIPTLVVYKGGREVARQAGAMPLPALLQWIRAHVRVVSPR